MTDAPRPQPAAMRGAPSLQQGRYFSGGHKTGASQLRALPTQLTLKFRAAGQSSEAEQRAAAEDGGRSLRAVLEAKEREHFLRLRREHETRHAGVTLAAVEDGPSASAAAPVDVLAGFDDADDDEALKSVSDDSDDDEDDTAELMRELERIRSEREAERERKEAEAAAVAAKKDADAAVSGNPLMREALAGGAFVGGAVKRRFGDDTVFSHTHSNEPEARKRFINDMIRSDFHRNFMRKFVV